MSCLYLLYFLRLIRENAFITGSIIYGANIQYQISTADGVHVRTVEGAIQYAQGKTLDSESGDVQKAKKFYTEANFTNLARDDILKGFCMGHISKENMYGDYLALQEFCCPTHPTSSQTTERRLLNEGFMQRNYD